MHLVKKVALATMCLLASQAFAQTEEMAVKLKTLEVIHPQEKRGDELYISVTEFPAQETARHYQVPAYPTHWLSKYVKNIKDVVIWKKSLSHCEPIDLLITLVEEDFAPWDLDDSLGSVQLKVECVNGKSVEKWVIPDPKTTAKITDQESAFSFTGENAEYRAIFKLEDAIPTLAPQKTQIKQ
jgi:hypothetical protein